MLSDFGNPSIWFALRIPRIINPCRLPYPRCKRSTPCGLSYLWWCKGTY
jgi:hypothetical protein